MIFDVLQIGAHLGNTPDDPVFERLIYGRETALLVEPLPFLVRRLRQNYKNATSAIVIEEAAVTTYDGKLDIWHVDPETVTPKVFLHHFSQLSSTEPDHIIKHFKPGMCPPLKATRVRCVTPDTLLKTHNVTELGHLFVDAEGHDAEVLKAFPFDRIRPRIIQFEHNHLTKSSLRDVLEQLRQFSYRTAQKDEVNTQLVVSEE